MAALRDWKQRTRTLRHPHHTEEIAYYDTFAGGYFSLTAGIAAHKSRIVYRCHLSFQLVGVPLDSNPILHLHEVLDVSEPSYFRPRSEQSVTRHWRVEADAVTLDHVGYFVTPKTLDESRDWVTGIVARNPYLRAEPKPDGWPEWVAKSELLVCDLRSHHPLDDPRVSYHLFNWETARTSDAFAVRVVADW